MNRMKHNRFVSVLMVTCFFLAGLTLSPQRASSEDVANQIKVIATLKGHGEAVMSVSFSPDGQLLASGSRDQTVKIWDVKTRTEIATLKGHKGFVRSVVFSPDGQLLASSGDDKTVKLWNVQKRKKIATLKGHKDYVLTVVFSPDGRLLASGSKDKHIKLWDVKKRKVISTLRGDGNSVSTVAFSPNGQLLAISSSPGTVKLWDEHKQKEIAVLKGHSGTVSSVVFSPNGRLLASGGWDKTIRLWDVQTWKEVAKLEGHSGYILTVAFSSDGRMLASGDIEGVVKLWDVQERKEIATLREHYVVIRAVTFNSDGTLLATCSDSKTIKLWNVELFFRPPKPKYNPSLQITASFAEPSGNNILEEGETASIGLVVHNTGKGEAYTLHLELKHLLSGSHTGISLGKPEPLARLNPGDSAILVATVIADEQVTDQTVELHLQVLEANGFDSDPVVVRFETRATRQPKLKISEWAIDDDSYGESQGNGNLQFELGEIVEVTLRVTNSGVGSTKNAKLQLGLPRDPNLFYQSTSTQFEIGDLPPGGSKDITFAISTNKRYKGDHIELSVQFTDARPRFNSTTSFQLPLEQKATPLTSIEIVPIAVETGTVEVLPSLTSLVDTDIPITGMHNPDAVAVIIGNTHYDDRDIPSVDFATRDAAIMKKYLIRTLGYDEGNILYYIDADLKDFSTVFGKKGRPKGRLYDYVKKNRSDVFVYYSGHGAPDPATKQAFLLPSDCDRSAISLTGFNRNTLFENLALLQARSITVVLDACFSGMSDAGSLMGDISPVYIDVAPSMTITNGVVFSSSKGDQISTWYREQKHGLFTYFFLKGLRGDADADGNGAITVQELEDYVTDPADGVPYWARRLKSRDQMPVVLASDKNKVLVELK